MQYPSLGWIFSIGNKACFTTISQCSPVVCGMMGLAPGYGWTCAKAFHIDTSAKSTVWVCIGRLQNDPIRHSWVYIPLQRDLEAKRQWAQDMYQAHSFLCAIGATSHDQQPPQQTNRSTWSPFSLAVTIHINIQIQKPKAQRAILRVYIFTVTL